VVVTGLGVVSPLGSLPAFWERLIAGEPGIAPLVDVPGCEPGRAPCLGAQVREWDPRAHLAAPLLRRMDRLSRMVASASRMAVADAGLALADGQADEVGIVIGTAFGNISESEQFIRGLVAKGRANPLTFPNTVLSAHAGYVAMDLGLRGPNLTVVRGEASGEGALALAYDTIVSGQAEVVLAGGGDEIAPILFHVYEDLGLLSPNGGGREWSSPFDRDRNGFVMGEGAAMLVLERREHARARGAAVRAELAGYATQSVPASAHDWPLVGAAGPDEIAGQLAECGWRPGRGDDLVLSAANSTARADAFEARWIADLLGDAVARTPVTSLKGAVGEFGAAGVLAAAAATLALERGEMPRLGSLRTPDPACRLRLALPGLAAPAAGFAHALVSVVPRGGSSLVLLLRRP
jgi:3-oxoacyl-[acyl-carrier-protein] synthase II